MPSERINGSKACSLQTWAQQQKLSTLAEHEWRPPGKLHQQWSDVNRVTITATLLPLRLLLLLRAGKSQAHAGSIPGAMPLRCSRRTTFVDITFSGWPSKQSARCYSETLCKKSASTHESDQSRIQICDISLFPKCWLQNAVKQCFTSWKWLHRLPFHALQWFVGKRDEVRTVSCDQLTLEF